MRPGFWWNEYSDFCPDIYYHSIVGKWSDVKEKYHDRGRHDKIYEENIFDNLKEAEKSGLEMQHNYWKKLDAQYPQRAPHGHGDY